MTQENKKVMFDFFVSLGELALTMNHYELARTENSPIQSPVEWKAFLMEPEIKDYIATELSIIRNAELNKITNDISGSHSVGQAQIIGALQKLDNNTATKEGPVFIYTYVPLSDSQKAAANVVELDHDPFLQNDVKELTVDEIHARDLKPVYLVTEIGKFWGIVNATKEKIIVPNLPDFDIDGLKIRKIKVYSSEV